MRLARIATQAGPRIALVEGPAGAQTFTAVDLEADLSSLLRAGTTLEEIVAAPRAAESVAGVRHLPLVRPGKVIAIGLNYLDHVRESGVEPPTVPLVFAKFPSSIVAHGDPIVLDQEVAERVDWEAELAVIVGERLRRADPDGARAAVFGYACANDVSARDVQFSDGQWTRGKSLDTFCPIGPLVVTADEVPDPQALKLTTRVNGEVMQSSSTAEMIFGVAEILSFCSASFTLEPGDVVLTGTPWGCGEFMNPRRSLAEGDLVEIEIERIGVLANPVVAS